VHRKLDYSRQNTAALVKKCSASRLYVTIAEFVAYCVRSHWCAMYLGFAGRKKRFGWTVCYKSPQERCCFARWRCRMYDGWKTRSCIGQQTTIPCRVILQFSVTGLCFSIYKPQTH